MDILDILIAKSITPQGKIETYAAQAQVAATKANTALSEANEAIEYLDTISSNVGAAAATEIDKLALTLTQTDASSYISNNIQASYPSNKETNLTNVVKYYKEVGENEDGTMTQKAITEALANTSNNLGQNNAGKIVVVDENGNIVSSDNVSEADLINILTQNNNNNNSLVDGIVGLDIDYVNYTYTRTQEAENNNPGSDFNKYAMYGGRKKCLVSNDGEIVAFYGDNNYNENQSNGYQVMIYQPKFYYRRNIIKTDTVSGQQIIRKENIAISSTPQSGFKLHPLFINENNEQIDYVLLSAYEGSIQSSTDNSYTNTKMTNFENQKLSSVAQAQPITGLNNPLTISTAERLATNRGTGWHITNIQFESAMQMLQMIEFDNLNGQQNIESGISNFSSGTNVSMITGSTISLGNESGHANTTTFIISGNQVIYSEEGKRAISYRGMENPWGNLWRYVNGINIIGNGSERGGRPYVCVDYNYSGNNYNALPFTLPSTRSWVSAFGYGGGNYDWIFIPVQCTGANSSFPIGDNIWVESNLNKTNILMCGGMWAYNLENGPFYYAADKISSTSTPRQNARLMYIPRLSNQYYTSNIQKWQIHYGG